MAIVNHQSRFPWMLIDYLTKNAICTNDGQFRHPKQSSEEN